MAKTAHKAPEPPEEWLRCFDEQDNEVKPRTRKWIWSHPKQFKHAIGSIWIINSRGQILCSKRADNLHGNPGKWQTYFGGKVPDGSNCLDTAVRELGEEIGIHADSQELTPVVKTKRIERYIFAHDGEIEDFTFPDGEIQAVRWMNLDRILEQQKDQAVWCNVITPEQEVVIKDFIDQLD